MKQKTVAKALLLGMGLTLVFCRAGFADIHEERDKEYAVKAFEEEIVTLKKGEKDNPAGDNPGMPGESPKESIVLDVLEFKNIDIAEFIIIGHRKDQKKTLR